MATRILNLNLLKKSLSVVTQRNLGASSIAMSKFDESVADPVQKLFLTKLNEYSEKSHGLEDLFEVSKEIVDEKNFMVGNVEKRFGTEAEMNEMPTFSWEN